MTVKMEPYFSQFIFDSDASILSIVSSFITDHDTSPPRRGTGCAQPPFAPTATAGSPPIPTSFAVPCIAHQTTDWHIESGHTVAAGRQDLRPGFRRQSPGSDPCHVDRASARGERLRSIRRAPHRGLVTGNPLHQLGQNLGVCASLFVNARIEKCRNTDGCGFGLILGHEFTPLVPTS